MGQATVAVWAAFFVGALWELVLKPIAEMVPQIVAALQ